MIFCKVMELNPKFLGGAKSDGFMTGMKKWFYYGFANRVYLSVWKIAGAGQKLPPDWKTDMVCIRGNIRDMQKPERRVDESIRIAGVRDAYMYKTDHALALIESVGNTTWEEKDIGRRSIKTGGHKKDCFTTQLTCAKDGTKLPLFLI